MHDYRESGNPPAVTDDYGNLTDPHSIAGTLTVTDANGVTTSAMGIISGVTRLGMDSIKWSDKPVVTLSEWMDAMERRLDALEGRSIPADAGDSQQNQPAARLINPPPIPPDGDDYTCDLRTLPQREAADLAALRAEINEHRRHYNAALDTVVFTQAAIESKMRSDLTALALRCDSLAEQVAVLSKRVLRLEGDNETLRAVVQRHGDWMQLRELRGEDAR